ncbi:unnamed protein product [Rotaria socialis]|nr:unnamed protein product [Rotaria socialis]CAF3401290.1 unnamed protein product [Rotaria socialis]
MPCVYVKLERTSACIQQTRLNKVDAGGHNGLHMKSKKYLAEERKSCNQRTIIDNKSVENGKFLASLSILFHTGNIY